MLIHKCTGMGSKDCEKACRSNGDTNAFSAPALVWQRFRNGGATFTTAWNCAGEAPAWSLAYLLRTKFFIVHIHIVGGRYASRVLTREQSGD